MCACARARPNFLLAGAHPARAVPLKTRNRSSPRLKKRLVPACPFTSLLSLPRNNQNSAPLGRHAHARTHARSWLFVGACSRAAGAVSLRLRAPVEAPSPAERSHPHSPPPPRTDGPDRSARYEEQQGREEGRTRRRSRGADALMLLLQVFCSRS